MRRSHHMPKRWLVKRRLLVVLRGHVYLDIWAAAIREVFVCSTEPTNIRKIFVVKFIRVKYFHTFSVYENIFTMKIKRITVACTLHTSVIILLCLADGFCTIWLIAAPFGSLPKPCPPQLLTCFPT